MLEFTIKLAILPRLLDRDAERELIILCINKIMHHHHLRVSSQVLEFFR
jgi:hypothetical protein